MEVLSVVIDSELIWVSDKIWIQIRYEAETERLINNLQKLKNWELEMLANSDLYDCYTNDWIHFTIRDIMTNCPNQLWQTWKLRDNAP